MKPRFKVGQKVRLIKHAPENSSFRGNWAAAHRTMKHDPHKVLNSVLGKADGYVSVFDEYYYIFEANGNGTWERLLEPVIVSNEERITARKEELYAESI